jgi:peptidoglycan DL-endopeptidase CwlO
MTVGVAGPLGAVARIQSLEARFTVAAPAGASSASTAAGAAGAAATSTDFASALAAAEGSDTAAPGCMCGQCSTPVPTDTAALASLASLASLGGATSSLGLGAVATAIDGRPLSELVRRVAPAAWPFTAGTSGGVPAVTAATGAGGAIAPVGDGLYRTADPFGPAAGSETVDASVPFADLFNAAGAAHGVSPRLLAAVAKTESGFRTDARSPAGAMGLMQFMPGTAAGFGIDPLDPAQAVDAAARLLKGNYAEFGSVELALAAYNAGGGSVRRAGGIPQNGETPRYVEKITGLLAGAS